MTSLIAETANSDHNPYHISDSYFEKVGIDRVKSIKIYYPNEMILFPGKK